ncbi:MAG: hypothetical protein EXR66_00065 [Dehalococcoidia bacterium]|nr:hypothetical protein [Dehalococcoidia bacterium]
MRAGLSTARICREEHGGALPRGAAELLALPGGWAFHRRDVRCFGFDEDAVAIDTNVVRLLGRLIGGDLQPARDPAHADRGVGASIVACW